MSVKRFRPLTDKLYWIILIPTVLLMAVMTVISAFAPYALLITILTDLMVAYFLISPLFGYVELREETVFIKYGFIMKNEIPYIKIREVVKARRFYADSMIALKNSFEHVNIKYNTFDIATVSVIDNDIFISELETRLFAKQL